MGRKRATAALILAIIGVSVFYLCAPFAWYLGRKELDAIEAGRSSVDAGNVKAAWVMGIVGTAILVSCVIGTALLVLLMKLGVVIFEPPKIEFVF